MYIETGSPEGLPHRGESSYDRGMDEARIEGVHTVLAQDAGGHELTREEHVSTADLPECVIRMHTNHPGANVLIDGQPATLMAAPSPDMEATIQAMPLLSDDTRTMLAGARLSHDMLWAAFDRSASAQAWALQQANAVTRDLLESQRRLADQACELQARFQESLQRIDLMETERKLIEHDLMARRLARHAVAQNRAEEEAARPPQPPGQPWLDELIAGVSAFLGAQRPQARTWEPKN